jgi:Domain of unknown function (DUF892)
VQDQPLNTILHKHSDNPAGHIHQTMPALICETERVLPMLKSVELRDAGLIGSLQRLKHYKIAAYGTAAALPRQLQLPDDEKTLRASLDEEKETDASLTVFAESEVNRALLASGIADRQTEYIGADWDCSGSETKDGIQRPCALGECDSSRECHAANRDIFDFAPRAGGKPDGGRAMGKARFIRQTRGRVSHNRLQ